ncbi:MAG: hypothetical protein E7L17_00145 [Clostridium sp.]|uniref:hypothetical protein n=1 Tax=Clostridium sp. TaxID=1506 RepID=UPI002913DB29|nr:hypothetical protein [Clostridium sp.]MDU7336507.1 hypothetical protein [Clostridium sp.]
MKKEFVFSFPHMGDYHVVIRTMLQELFPGQKVMSAPPTTQRTLELGSKYSPDFVCSPFKFNMGNYIEALDKGANVLLQTGLGCRYGYYGEVQEQILRDLGYDFEFLCFSRALVRPEAIYRVLRKLECPLSLREIVSVMMRTAESLRIMDALDYYIRENVGFEVVPGSFEKLQRQLLQELSEPKTMLQLERIKTKYARAAEEIPIKKIGMPLRVGVIGELYTLMEPFSNFYIEKQLARRNISVSRRMSVSFLLFGKKDRISLRESGGYLKYTVGANGVDSVCQAKQYAELGYDGLIHMKSFGCIPELNATPALTSVEQDYGMPILHLSFDANTSEVGVETRLEAFADMIEMRRNKAYGTARVSGG